MNLGTLKKGDACLSSKVSTISSRSLCNSNSCAFKASAGEFSGLFSDSSFLRSSSSTASNAASVLACVSSSAVSAIVGALGV